MYQKTKEKSDNINNSSFSQNNLSPKDEIDNSNKYFTYFNEDNEKKKISDTHTNNNNNQGFLYLNINESNKNAQEERNYSLFANKKNEKFEEEIEYFNNKITEEEFHGKIFSLFLYFFIFFPRNFQN